MADVGGLVWGVAIGGMLLALLVLFVHRARKQAGGWPMVGIGVLIGLGVAAAALLLRE